MISLTILTTADPTLLVMAKFGEELSGFSRKNQIKMRWIIVDGLHAYNEQPLLLNDTPLLETDWVKPERPLSQLSSILYGLKKTNTLTIVMDPDMSDNVVNITDFITTHQQGAQIVFGYRKERHGISFTRKILTNLFNILAKRILDISIHDINTPMISLTQESISLLLASPKSIHSPRMYTYHKMRAKLREVPIRVAEIEGKISSYTLFGRLAIGLARINELTVFWCQKKFQGVI